jgi:prepilin-type N-terminal cleavage/methylation domain-containing protein
VFRPIVPPAPRFRSTRLAEGGPAANAPGFTIVEILIVISLIAIVSSLAVIGIRHARVRATETAAVAALRVINQAQSAYMHGCGNQAYAPTLVSLGTPPPGSDSAFLSPDLAQSDPLQKSGYIIALGGTVKTDAVPTCNGVVPLESYYLTADPVNPGHSGVRSFGTNSDRIVYGDVATYVDNMPESGAPGHGTEVR